jgi:hydrogenase expression/formation protein HypC
VLNIEGEDPAFRFASVDFCGVRKTINLAFTPEVQPGDFVLVHVGFAISRIDEEEAHRTYEYLRQIGALTEEGLDLSPGVEPVEARGAP